MIINLNDIMKIKYSCYIKYVYNNILILLYFMHINIHIHVCRLIIYV